MGALLSIRSARLEKWAVRRGLLADLLLSGERRRGHRNSWRQSTVLQRRLERPRKRVLGRAAFVQRADIAQRVGDDSAAIVVRPVVG
jgi:exopolyphosphatase/pppGpp-phosphohydrolase